MITTNPILFSIRLFLCSDLGFLELLFHSTTFSQLEVFFIQTSFDSPKASSIILYKIVIWPGECEGHIPLFLEILRINKQQHYVKFANMYILTDSW